jgi:alpha-tubulin suppressor-like RCC1 family protein
MIIGNGVQFGNGVIITNYNLPNLYTWGRNNYGQLGNGTTTNTSSPIIPTIGGTSWNQVACGRSHTVAIKTDGTLWSCGYGSFGVLGTNTGTTSSFVQEMSSGTNWKQVAGGGRHSAAIKTDGTLWSWGLNYNGVLGIGSSVNFGQSSPVTTINGGITWSQVACGYNHTAAVKTDGTLWTWGNNNYGRLGNSSTTNTSSPVTVSGGGTTWQSVACGYRHTAAIKTDGTLWTCGYGGYGILGNNTGGTTSSPVTTAGGGTTWSQVACGYTHTAAIKTDGTLWFWGNFGNGGSSSPVTVAGSGTGWSQVAAGGSNNQDMTAAIKTDGTLWTCGYSSYGASGANSNIYTTSMVQVVGGISTWKSVGVGFNHAAAVS